MASWWDVSQTVADGISIVPSWLWLIRDRSTVTSPKMVLKVKGRVPRRWMPAPAFAVPVLENQFLIGLLDQDLEEPALDFETGLMNVRLNLVGEMLVLPWHGHGDLQPQCERQRLAVRLDGAEGDGSLKTVGGTHGVSPYVYYGRCILRAFLSIR